MNPAEVDIALRRFRQVDGGLARRHGGTGLGLPIAKSLIELHRGRFTIASARGEGAAGIIRLPAAEAPGAADPAPALRSPAPAA